MYVKSEILKDIESYSLSKNIILLNKIDGKVFKNNELLVSDALGGYVDCYGLINVVTDEEVLWYYKSKIILKTDHRTFFVNKLKNESLYLFVENEFNYGYYDINTNEIIRRFSLHFEGIFPSEIYDNSLIYHLFPLSQIQRISLETKQVIWQIDLSEYGKIRKVLGVVQDTLWVTLNVKDENSGSNLVAININTGKVKKTFYNIWREFNSCNVSFIKENRFLVSIRNQTFLEFDTESLVETRKLNLESLVVENLKIKRYIIYKDKIYFTAVNGKYIVANILGVLDYDTLEVLWHTKLDVGTNQYPQVTDDKLYIINKNNELLIFDRTDKQT